MGGMTVVCVVVLNWNGQQHLPVLVASLLRAKERYEACCDGHCRLIVLDNPGPTDDVAWLQEHYPGIECVRALGNDFLYSYNWLLPRLSEPIVVLLNNDLRVDPDFLLPLVEPFTEDSSLFATSACSLSWDGAEVNGGAFRLAGQRGWFWWDMFSPTVNTPTLFAVGGYMAVDRIKFLKLGGFDQLFYPAYGEDIDLSLRAWERGWRSLFIPTSRVFHREGASWQIGDRRDHLFRLAHLLLMERYFSSPQQQIGRFLHLLRQLLRPGLAMPISRAWLATLRRFLAYRGRRHIPFCFPAA